MSGAGGTANPFNPKLIAGVIAAGVIAFVALLALVALGPQIGSGNDGGGHALSKAAPGFAAIVDLMERTGGGVEISRNPDRMASDDERNLLVLTPTQRTRPDEIARIIAAHGDNPVLLVLPKWQANREPGKAEKPGWVASGYVTSPPVTLIPAAFGPNNRIERRNAEKAIGVDVDTPTGKLFVPLPRAVSQVIEGPELAVLIAHPVGGALLAVNKGNNLYILADPDLISNLAFESRQRAHAALLLLDAIAEDAGADTLAFDVTLNGFGGEQNLLRYAFVPPFSGISLCLIAAALLAFWQAWVRFGPPLTPRRAIPISKAALITNSADLVKQAGREVDGADAYAANIRAMLARRMHAPYGLDDAATDRWIDRMIAPDRTPFSTLARRLPLARNRHELLADAQALHQTRKELLRDSEAN